MPRPSGKNDLHLETLLIREEVELMDEDSFISDFMFKEFKKLCLMLAKFYGVFVKLDQNFSVCLYLLFE